MSDTASSETTSDTSSLPSSDDSSLSYVFDQLIDEAVKRLIEVGGKAKDWWMMQNKRSETELKKKNKEGRLENRKRMQNFVKGSWEQGIKILTIKWSTWWIIKDNPQKAVYFNHMFSEIIDLLPWYKTMVQTCNKHGFGQWDYFGKFLGNCDCFRQNNCWQTGPELSTTFTKGLRCNSLSLYW